MPLIWTPPPPNLPSLQEGDVCLWAIDLHKISADHDSLLSADEHRRADRFLGQDKAKQFRAAHGVLRAILARHTGRTGPLRFSRRDGGQPCLDPVSTIEFSLSHSYHHGLIAVTHGRAIGADIERIRPMPDSYKIARTWFAAEESEQIGAENEPSYLFLSYWTLKEAVIKATGEGLRRPLASFRIGVDASGTFRMLAFDGAPGPDWSLLSFEPMPNTIGAVAVRGPIKQLWCWQF